MIFNKLKAGALVKKYISNLSVVDAKIQSRSKAVCGGQRLDVLSREPKDSLTGV